MIRLGRSIYFSNKEIEALRNAVDGYIGKIEDAGTKGSMKLLNKELESGLGSALKKLYKGTNGEDIWKDY